MCVFQSKNSPWQHYAAADAAAPAAAPVLLFALVVAVFWLDVTVQKLTILVMLRLAVYL